MFGLTFEKILIIGVIAVFLLGPEKLPHYAAQLGRLVRQLRDMANGAKDRMREEMGPDFDDVDWKKLDPRQYDPRRIIREALVDDEPPAPTISRSKAPVVAAAAATAASTVAGGTVAAAPGVNPDSAYLKRKRKLEDGAATLETAPFDSEAT
jgi:Sec-independent protein translocase protein TatA